MSILLLLLLLGVPWLPDEINDGRLEYYSFLLAGVLLLNLALFVLIARRYRYNCLGVPSTVPGTPCDASSEFHHHHQRAGSSRRPSLSSAGPLVVVTLPDPT